MDLFKTATKEQVEEVTKSVSRTVNRKVRSYKRTCHYCKDTYYIKINRVKAWRFKCDKQECNNKYMSELTKRNKKKLARSSKKKATTTTTPVIGMPEKTSGKCIEVTVRFWTNGIGEARTPIGGGTLALESGYVRIPKDTVNKIGPTTPRFFTSRDEVDEAIKESLRDAGVVLLSV